MNAKEIPIIILPGATGNAPGPELFGGAPGEIGGFALIKYPGWRRYVADDFTADVLISDLVAQIVAAAPQGPIRILGISLGGHFGYAAALRLQASGREIGGFCAIDTFMDASAAPRPGWGRRALSQVSRILQKRQLNELVTFVVSRFWRSLLQLSGAQSRSMLNKSAAFRHVISIAAREPVFEEELSLRLLLREVSPWVRALDIDPVQLRVPATLIRTAETAIDDPAWRRRCPDIEIVETAGTHQTMFDPENAFSFRERFLAGTRTWLGATESNSQWTG
jgi:thioesterase domain-containing protein